MINIKTVETNDEGKNIMTDLCKSSVIELFKQYVKLIVCQNFFNKDDLKFVWDLIRNNGMKRNAIAELMQIKPIEVDKLYELAYRKFNKLTIKNESIILVDNKNEFMINSTEHIIKYQRPKAIYSNKSPYGIANEE